MIHPWLEMLPLVLLCMTLLAMVMRLLALSR
jgi:hypothetical protein